MKHTEYFHRCENCGHIWPVEKSQTLHNSDYAAALKVWDEFGERADGMLDSQFGYWVTQRLNQSKD